MIQKRNIAMYIILSIVTCGIFGIYWFICLTDDSKLAANDNESASGPVAFLLTIVTCGIYSWYWAYKLGDRVDYAANSRGIGDGSSNSKILFIVLQLLHRISSIKSQIMIHSTAMVIMDLMAVTAITTIILIIIHSTITMQLLIAHTAVIQIITHQIAVMLIMYLTMPIMTVHHMEALPVKNQVTVIQVQ